VSPAKRAGTNATDWTARAPRPRRAAPAKEDKDRAPPQRMHAHVARAGGKKGGTRTRKPPEISGRYVPYADPVPTTHELSPHASAGPSGAVCGGL